MPKVSVVLPTYNGSKYIKQSIESVISQTFTDWELIIVDDCSDDGTDSIVDNFARTDDRIKVIHNKVNQKLPMSLNIGFRAAQGEYLTWTSDDNIFLPNAISNMVEILDENELAGMVCANMYVIDEFGSTIGEKCVGINDLCASNCVGACFLYRSSVLKRIGEYDTDLFLVEDYDYWIRIEKEYGSIIYCNEILYKYRRHSESLSDKRKIQVDESRAFLREKHKKYIINKFRDNPKELFGIVYENCKCNKRDLSINKEIITMHHEFAPLLTDISSVKKVVVFGAGEYGKRFIANINKEVLFFVDNDLKKIDTTIENYIVKPVSSVEKIDDDTYIVVAVSCEHMISVLGQLYDMRIKRIAVSY